MEVRFLNRNEIDIKKWDISIENSINSHVYANSWYLDITAQKKWAAIILGDYKYVMPFAFSKKYFIKYIYQPFFTQQLGIFSEKEITKDIIDIFISYLGKKYRFINMNLNYANKLSGEKFIEKTNYELKLNLHIDYLEQNFSKNTKTYIKKSLQQNLIFSNKATIEEIINLKRNKPTINLDNGQLNLLHNLLQEIKQRKLSKTYSVFDENGNLISALFFVFWKNRAYYIFSESNEEGRKKFASFYLMNRFINEHAENNLILDFEGSMLPGVARFFKGWGATNNPYYNFKLNRLPLFLKLLKK